MQKFKLFSPLQLDDLLKMALEHPDTDYNERIHLPKDELINFYKHKLLDKAQLLEDNFSICLDKDSETLIALPVIYDLVKPYPEELPMFILRLACDVDYSNELKYFHQIAEELSFYYAKMSELALLHCDNNDPEQVKKIEDEVRLIYEHELFTDMKKSLVVRKRFAQEGDMTFAMVTCTENLYRVFERC